jgi:hypothetical protein
MRRALLAVGTLTVAAVVAVGGLYLSNAAPAAPVLSAVEASDQAKPFVVKLHAQWCHKCLLTQGMWARVDDVYGSRVKRVVFDFTSDESTERTRVEATRLGLERLYDAYNGVSGAVIVLDPRTKEVLADIDGSRDFSAYQRAIDQAIQPD